MLSLPQAAKNIGATRSTAAALVFWKRGAARVSLAAMTFLILSILVVVWAWHSHKPWSELGLARPRNWAATIALGTLFGIAFKFCMKAIVMPLLGADPVNQAYHYLAGNRAAATGFILTILLLAGVCEEVFVRGFL